MKYSKIVFGSIFIIVLNFVLLKSGVIEYFDYRFYDVINSFEKTTNTSNNSSVVIVDIDEKSLASLGQWPWSRVILAKLLHSISSANPSSIGLDVIFAEPDKTSPKQMVEFYKNYFSSNITIEGLPTELYDNDAIFAKYIKDSGVTLAVFLNNSNLKQKTCTLPAQTMNIKDSSNIGYRANNILCNINEIQGKGSNVGFINSSQDLDGIFRRLPLLMQYQNSIIPALGLATFNSIDKITIDKKSIHVLDHTIQTGDNSEVLLNFYHKNWYTTISAVDLLLGKVDKDTLKGKFVLLGSSAIGLHDNYLISSGENLAGVKIHATLIDNIINDELKYQPLWVKNINLLLAILVSLLLVFYMQIKEQVKILKVFIVVNAFYFAFSFYMLSKAVYVSSAYFVLPLSIVFVIINAILIIYNYKEKQDFYAELNKAHSSTIDSMALVVESRDTETGAHIKRTKEYINCMCEYLYKKKMYKDVITKEYISLIYRASPLHDIGKVAIPDDILKKPGKLTSEEFAVMKNHPSIGKEVLEHALHEHENNKFLKMAMHISYSHHEKWDGSGYPQGLKGDEIPLEARMMALADVYDALISKRVYKQALSFEESAEIIVNGRGSHFDPTLVDVFIVLKEDFKDIALKISS
jgi:adenylate cyclase